jgi:hypothetical protein
MGEAGEGEREYKFSCTVHHALSLITANREFVNSIFKRILNLKNTPAACARNRDARIRSPGLSLLEAA